MQPQHLSIRLRPDSREELSMEIVTVLLLVFSFSCGNSTTP
jgi:hypothetical protein